LQRLMAGIKVAPRNRSVLEDGVVIFFGLAAGRRVTRFHVRALSCLLLQTQIEKQPLHTLV